MIDAKLAFLLTALAAASALFAGYIMGYAHGAEDILSKRDNP